MCLNPSVGHSKNSLISSFIRFYPNETFNVKYSNEQSKGTSIYIQKCSFEWNLFKSFKPYLIVLSKKCVCVEYMCKNRSINDYDLIKELYIFHVFALTT